MWIKHFSWCGLFLAINAYGAIAYDASIPPPPPIPLHVPQTHSDKTPILTLRDAIYLAMRYNTTIQSAELQRVLDKFSLIVARNQFYPQVSLTGQALYQNGAAPSYNALPTVSYLTPYGQQITTGLTQTITSGNTAAVSTAANLSITQPLLRGFGRHVTLASLYTAQDSEAINQLNFKNSVISQVIAVITAYYQVVQASNSLKVNELALRDEQNTLQQTQAKVKVGKAAPTEGIQQALNIANSQLAISQNQNAAEQSLQTLLGLLGLDPNTTLQVDPKIDYPKPMIPSLLESQNIALAHNIGYQSALISYKTLNRNLMLAKDQQKWQLDATANLLQTISGNQNSGTLNSQNVTLNLSIPVHDVARQQQLVSAKIALDQAKLNLLQLKRQLLVEVTNAYHNVEFNQRQQALAESTVQLAEQNLAVTKLKFNYGKATSFELTSSQTALTNARVAFISQQIQYITAVEALFQTLGTTLERWDMTLKY